MRVLLGSKLGWTKYGPEHLSKVNSLREAASLVHISSAPLLDKGQVAYSSPESAHNEPRSCYNCWMMNATASTCRILGPTVGAKKFSYGEQKLVEYWPVCGEWDYGSPNAGAAQYKSTRPFDDPDDLGFGYVNAPSVGQPLGGTCCGGGNGGDECDNYMTKSDDKRAPLTGFCRVLQTEVPQMACCTAWRDDDFIQWRDAQKILESQTPGYKAPNPLLR